MHLVYFIDIFEDNYNIVGDYFKTDSVNAMKNRLLVVAKKQKGNFSVYQLGAVTSVNHEFCH